MLFISAGSQQFSSAVLLLTVLKDLVAGAGCVVLCLGAVGFRNRAQSNVIVAVRNAGVIDIQLGEPAQTPCLSHPNQPAAPPYALCKWQELWPVTHSDRQAVECAGGRGPQASARKPIL